MGLVSGYDEDRSRAIVRWPLVEVLNACMEKLRRNALEQYRNSLLVWAALAPWQKKKSQAPQPPDILKDD